MTFNGAITHDSGAAADVSYVAALGLKADPSWAMRSSICVSKRVSYPNNSAFSISSISARCRRCAAR